MQVLLPAGFAKQREQAEAGNCRTEDRQWQRSQE
jgi:hypothetical protein